VLSQNVGGVERGRELTRGDEREGVVGGLRK